jgi:tetratricopeptide (TPR) repeat protein
LFAKADALDKLGRYEEEIKCYDEVLKIDPKDYIAWYYKGSVLCDLERYEEAIRCYDKAIEIDPEYKKAKENKTIAEEKVREQEGKLRDLREKAWKSLSEAENIFNEIKNKGVIISSDLLTKSKQAFDNGDYEGSVRLSEELKNLVNNREIKYREARDWIKSAESAIGKVKDFGCDTSEAEELLNRTRTGFEEGSYAQAISDASKSEKVTKEIKEKSKPEIEVDLSEKTFQPNVWEEISLNIFNKGNAHAKDIEIGLSEEVKVKDLEIIRSLNAGEKRDLAVSFKPVEVGRVPLEISTHFKDFDGKEYEEKNMMHIHVGEKRKEYKEAQIEIIIERAIYDPCKRDFIERALPRMKEWINRYDPGAYWFAVSIQNNTDRAIEEWGVDLTMSAALKIKFSKAQLWAMCRFEQRSSNICAILACRQKQ